MRGHKRPRRDWSFLHIIRNVSVADLFRARHFLIPDLRRFASALLPRSIWRAPHVLESGNESPDQMFLAPAS